MSELWARVWPLVSLMAIVAAATLVGGLGGADTDQVVLVGLIQLIFVVGLYVFVGNSGVLSFGHMGFAAIGAYSGALLVTPPEQKQAFFPDMPSFFMHLHTSATMSIVLGGLVAAAFALILAVPIMRLNGLTASLATFTLLIIVYVVASHWDNVTGGQSGMNGVPIGTTRTVVLVWALLALAAAYLFQRSTWGMRLQASREDETAARASGVNVALSRDVAWVLSAFVTGAGGALYGQFLGTFTPDAFYLSAAFVVLSMLVVGGLTSLSGAVVGTILLTVVAEALRRLEGGVDLGALHVPGVAGLSNLGLAVIMLLVLLTRPRGITGGRELRWKRPARRADRSPSSPAPRPQEPVRDAVS